MYQLRVWRFHTLLSSALVVDRIVISILISTMICSTCRHRLAQQHAEISRRAFSSTNPSRLATPVTAQTATATNPRPDGRPAATSTSAAQPFSTPLSPKPSKQELPIKRDQKVAPAKLPQSSVPAGTVLKGLNFMKGKQDPVAMEDHEYPDWLWRVLERKDEAGAAKGASEGDLFGMCLG